MSILKVKKLIDEAVIPSFKTPGAAGMDLTYPYKAETWINPGQTLIVPVGISIELEPGYEAQIRPRSGLAALHGVTVLNTPGTIDSDYRGEVKVILINHSSHSYKIVEGDRIAQMVIAKYEVPTIEEVVELSETERGEGGLGSTGKN